MIETVFIRTTANQQGRTKGYGSCPVCSDSWSWKPSHTTSYKFEDLKDVEGNAVCKNVPTCGIFPLCEECWSSMTPDERWPYYERLVLSWNDPDRLEDIPLIKKFVMEGK